jgi:UDP-3-O-[3-hydroxymyristoyl] glucosamine N-acyltransferase
VRRLSAATAPRLAQIVADLGGELHGDGAACIQAIAALEHAGAGDIAFLANPKLRAQLATTQASALIIRADCLALAQERGAAVIVTPDPYLYFARLTRWWAARTRKPAVAGVHPTAVVGERVQIHPSASIGPYAVIGDDVVIGEGAVIGAQVFVGDMAEIGAFTRFAPGVRFLEGCRIGARGLLESGAIIGGDGFGFAPHQGTWEKIEQLGAVWIGDDVEIGANTCVDRGALDDTFIDDGVKLDNQIQIAHNVHIGKHTAMAGCVGVAGSAKIGAHCTFGGAAMILGHLEIADHVHISSASVVMRSLLKPGVYTGAFPIDENSNWEKNAATLRQLHTLRNRVRALEKQQNPTS